MKRVVAGAFLFVALLALPAMAQRGMSAGRGFGGHGFGGHTGGGRGVFVGGAVAPHGFVPHSGTRGFVPHSGIVIRHPGAGIFIGTGPFPGHFHHGHRHPFFPNSICFQNPAFCRGAFGFSPWFSNGWPGAWPGYGYGYALPYVSTYSDTYSDEVQATLAQQQQMIADLEEQVRQERLNRMETDAAQPAPAPAPAPAPQSSASQPITPTVLVFRDRHQVEVRNYAIVGDTLYEFAPQWTRKISLTDLDLPATVRINEERGVRFIVPSSRAQVVTRP